MKSKKIIFMGTPDFAVPALQKLAASAHHIIAVYTAPPKPAGRGRELKKSAVHLAAESLGLPVFTPPSLKAEQLPQADIAVVAAYGLLLPEHILNSPKFGCINIHPSLLPRWRGAAPIQRTIMAGDTQTAVCIMKMDKGLDTGDVLATEKFALEAINAGELHDKCAALGAEMVLRVVAEIETLKPQKQSEQGVTYAKKITREDEKINWQQPAEVIERQIRGLNPFPAAYFEYNGEKIKVLAAEIICPLPMGGKTSTSPLPLGGKTSTSPLPLGGEGGGLVANSGASENPPPNLLPARCDGATARREGGGKVLDDMLTISCGSGAIRITQLQKPGKRAMTAKEFLNGYKIPQNAQI